MSHSAYFYGTFAFFLILESTSPHSGHHPKCVLFRFNKKWKSYRFETTGR